MRRRRNAAPQRGKAHQETETAKGGVTMWGIESTFWAHDGSTAAALTNKELKAAPGAGKAIYITDIHFSNEGTANQAMLLDGSGGAAVYNEYMAISQARAQALKTPIKLTGNTALCITTTAADHFIVDVGGYIDNDH
jgi:hypothetical protein